MLAYPEDALARRPPVPPRPLARRPGRASPCGGAFWFGTICQRGLRAEE